MSRTVPTHVKGHKMYIAAAEMTTVVNTTSMKDLAVVPHSTYDTYAYPPGSYAPFNTNFMVTANPNQNPVNILRYLNASLQFDNDQLNFVGANANDVIIYTNSSGMDVPIIVLARIGYAGVISVWSPNYQITIPGNNVLYDSSYVQNNQYVLHYHTTPQGEYTTAIFDVV